MLRDLPELIYPLELARAGRFLCGRVTLAGMARLRPMLTEGGAPDVGVELQFDRDDRGRPGIQGTVQADLNLICQRCLEAVPFRAEIKVSVLLLGSDGQIDLGSDAARGDGPDLEPEPLVVEGGQAVALSDLVEEELLLALPMVPMHPGGLCRVVEKYLTTGLPDERENPFAALVAAKTRQTGP